MGNVKKDMVLEEKMEKIKCVDCHKEIGTGDKKIYFCIICKTIYRINSFRA